MGTMFIFYMIYLFCLILTPCLQACRSTCRCMARTSTKLSESIFWSTLVTLMNESYMIIVVCVLINIQILSWDSLGLQVMSVLCAVFLFLSVALPIIFVSTLRRNFDDLKKPEVFVKYHALYDELKLDVGKKALLVPSFFLFRRFLLGIAICVVGRVLIWQVYIMAAQIIAQVMIIGSGVFLLKSKTRMEYFNELILMQTMYTIISFSPFGPDEETRFYLGYATITIVCLHLIVNLFMIFSSTVTAVKLRCRRKMAMRKQRRDRDKLKARLEKGHADRKNRWTKLRKEAERAAEKKLERLPSEGTETLDDSSNALVQPNQLGKKQRSSVAEK